MKEIAIIGGGLGGCLSALMLAKQKDEQGNPLYHITLIESKPRLLDGASVIASRLHLGGEYPLSPDTAADCIYGAVAWKLLMPENIYTKVPPMKFLIASETEKDGKEIEAEARLEPSFKKTKVYQESLTEDKFENAYKRAKRLYLQLYERIGKAFDYDPQKNLFGQPKDFYRKLEEHEYQYKENEQGSFGYTKVIGGFQTQEQGLNVIKYLTLIDKEIKAQEKAGRISVKTGCTVPETGIIAPKDDQKKFLVDCMRSGSHEIKPFDQIIVAAWQGGLNLPAKRRPEIGEKEKILAHVHKRAMLRLDLPKGFNTPPAFIMLGKHGGMLSPYNDKVAICYLPMEDVAYIKSEKLTNYHPRLPKDWNDISEQEKAERQDAYFEEVKKRFPVLKNATNPHLIIRDTISFERNLTDRTHQAVIEQPVPVTTIQSVRQEQILLQMMTGDHEAPRVEEETPGLFKLYPTKATYAPYAALQIVNMVKMRANEPFITKVVAPERRETIEYILGKDKLKGYSLADMGKSADILDDPTQANKDYEPSTEEMAEFLEEHQDLKDNMLIDSWPEMAAATQAAKVTSRRNARHRKR